jgi:hypothetical protein
MFKQLLEMQISRFSKVEPSVIRAIPCKPRSHLLNRGPQILLNLIHIVKSSVLWIMAQAISKNIEPSILPDPHTKSPIRDYLPKGGTNATMSREGHIRRIWNFFHTYILLSYSLTNIFTIPNCVLRILWISKYKQKSIFSTTWETHNFWLEWGKDLRTLFQIDYLLMYLL